MVATLQYDADILAPPHDRQIHIDDLVRRLDRGLVMIEREAASGRPVEHLEDHWLSLLRQYESDFDQLAR